MNSPRKAFLVAITSAVVILSAASPILAQEPAAEKRAALKVADEKYITAADKGAFNLSGKGVTNRTVFAIVDANGGVLADGDEVMIKYYASPADKPSFLQDQGGKLIRDKEPKDESGKFKLKQQGEGFVLQTAGGKFVVYKSRELEIADTSDGAVVFTFEEQAATP